jgi:hypothetical protein
MEILLGEKTEIGTSTICPNICDPWRTSPY